MPFYYFFIVHLKDWRSNFTLYHSLWIVKEVEIGEVYTGKVVKIEDFGAFVELWPGCEGLVHVSQLDNKRIEHPSDILKVGDEIVVKAIGYDKRGKLNLSRKELLPKTEKKENKKDKKSKNEE